MDRTGVCKKILNEARNIQSLVREQIEEGPKPDLMDDLLEVAARLIKVSNEIAQEVIDDCTL